MQLQPFYQNQHRPVPAVTWGRRIRDHYESLRPLFAERRLVEKADCREISVPAAHCRLRVGHFAYGRADESVANSNGEQVTLP